MAQVRRARGGSWVEVDDDVGGVARDLREIDPGLCLRFSEVGEYFAIYHDDGQRESLVLTTKELDARVVERVRRIDSRDYDYARELDKQDALAEKDRAHENREKVGPIAERLAHAIRKDTDHKGKVFLPRGV